MQKDKLYLLFTGGSGFLGKIVIPILQNNYEVVSIGIGEKDQLQIDLSKEIPKLTEKFDIVIHAAGKAHSIPKNSQEELIFFQINTEGTKNLCSALEFNPPQALLFLSTVAVYGVEKGLEIDENHQLNGSSPYALSKIEAENYLKEWCRTHNVILTILRPTLIAGTHPPGNLGAMIDGIKKGKYFRIGAGESRKSILMAEDIARLIPKVLDKGGIYNVCDNHHPSFAELEELICKQLGIKTPKSIPFWLANLFAKCGDILGSKAPINTIKLEKITKSLTFSNNKAKRELGWEPLDVLENFKIE